MTAKRKQKSEKLSAKELEDICKRIQADFENYRKRSQKEKEEFGRYANEDLVLRILPVKDNLSLATEHLPKKMRDDNWVRGVLQIEKQLEQILAQEGVEKIESLGRHFDPHLHEAVEEVESERPPGEIVEEVLAGYQLSDKVIRPAKVKVSKKDKNPRDDT